MADFESDNGPRGPRKPSDSGAPRREGGSFKPRGDRPYGDRPARAEGGERRPYTPRPPRDGEASGERRPYTPRGEGTGERRPYAGRAPREGGFGERSGGGERRPYTPRGEGTGERRPYTPRSEGTGERRPYTPRGEGTGERRPYQSRDGGGERRPYSPRPPRDGESSGERRPYSPRPPREGARDGGYERKPYSGDRKSFGDRPREGGRDRFGGGKPAYGKTDRPRRDDFKSRPPRPEDDRVEAYRDASLWEGPEEQTEFGGRPKRQVAFMHPQADGWLVGPHAVKAALKAGRRVGKEIWLLSEPDAVWQPLLAAYPELQVQVKERSAFDTRFGDLVHQGIALQVGTLPQPDLADVLAGAPQILVVLDQVTDPHNVGAVLRSCAAYGVGGMILPERRSASVTPVVAKAAAGGLETVPVIEVVNLAQTLKTIKEAGYTVLGLAGEGTLGLNDVKVEGKICLVLGSEGDGLRRLTRESCDHLVRIPQSEAAVGSLNVSVASGIALYALTR